MKQQASRSILPLDASATKFDVVGIGNAIVDIIATCDDEFLKQHDLPKGHMQLINTEQAEALYQAMGPGIESSGGSAANTMAGLASLGGRAAFIGKVADDQLGEVFRHDLTAAGVSYETAPTAGASGKPTARCLILVTPDGERTMNTYLGASVELGNGEVSQETIAAAGITYLEGYLFDPPEAKAAFFEAARMAADAGRKVALSLSDGFCVDRHRAAFRSLIKGGVDILFANEEEICSLYETTDFDEACRQVSNECRLAALTRGAKGSVIVFEGEMIPVAAEPVSKVVDTTGAGDLYAAGFLYGLTRQLDLETSARLGGLAAAEIISHMGARPAVSLAKLVEDSGLLAA